MEFDIFVGSPNVTMPLLTYEIFWETVPSEAGAKKILWNPPPEIRLHHKILVARERTEVHDCRFFSIVDTHSNRIEKERKDIVFFDGLSLLSVKRPDQRVEWDIAGFLAPHRLKDVWPSYSNVKELYLRHGEYTIPEMLHIHRGRDFMVDQFLKMMKELDISTRNQKIAKAAFSSKYSSKEWPHWAQILPNYTSATTLYSFTHVARQFIEKNLTGAAQGKMFNKYFVEPFGLAEFLVYCYSLSELTDRP